MNRCPFFALLCGRSVARSLDAIHARLTQMEKNMSALSDKIAELKTAVEAERTEHAQEVKDAVAKARAAWQADDEAEHKQALADLDSLIGTLKAPSPVFTPSGN